MLHKISKEIAGRLIKEWYSHNETGQQCEVSDFEAIAESSVPFRLCHNLRVIKGERDFFLTDFEPEEHWLAKVQIHPSLMREHP